MKTSQSLELLTTLEGRQQEQFIQATILAIGIIMKKLGVDSVSVGTEDFEALQAGEKVQVIPNIGGGFTYNLVNTRSLESQQPEDTSQDDPEQWVGSPSAAHVLVLLADATSPLSFKELEQRIPVPLFKPTLDRMQREHLIDRRDTDTGYRWMPTSFGLRHVTAAREYLEHTA